MKGLKFPVAPNGKIVGEKEAKEALEKMGITEKMLQQHKEKGAKSSIMGTYRILLHKNGEKNSSGEKENNSKKVVMACPSFKSRACIIM